MRSEKLATTADAMSSQAEQPNLIDQLPNLGRFDVIFLRNVMIYFDMTTKQRLLERIIQRYLKPDGYLFISHSETLNGIKTHLKLVSTSIYKNKA